MDVRRVRTGELGELAAEHVVSSATRALDRRDEFVVAFSGGTTPIPMFDALVESRIDWTRVHVLQVDERIAPDGDPDRNLGQLSERLLEKVDIPYENIHPMPVTLDDLEGALRAYRAMLRRVAGDPPVADLVHLGIGADGHVASIFPEGNTVEVTEREVVLTGERAGRRRMTVTLPFLNRARERLWLVAGEDKREAVARLIEGDESMPAGMVTRENATLILDPPADPRNDAE